MTIVKARSKTARDKNGAAIVAEFEHLHWLTKVQPSGEWVFIEKYEQIEEPTQARGLSKESNHQTETKKVTIKKGCGCGK
jgi:hypothetical protein